MSLYWLVVDESHGKPIALVKTQKSTARVIAGNNTAISGFRRGYPDGSISEPWHFDLLTDKCYHPLVGEWITKLGPVETSAQRLRKLREKEEKQKGIQAKRERAKNLNPGELADIQNSLSRDVGQVYLAEKYGVSESFIKRLAAEIPSKVPEAGVPDLSAPEAPKFGALRVADIALGGGEL